MRLTPVWRPAKNCPKCDGHGWLWGHELDEYHGDGSPVTDDTKYACDHSLHLHGTALPNGERA